MSHTNPVYDLVKHFKKGELGKLYSRDFHFKRVKIALSNLGSRK